MKLHIVIYKFWASYWLSEGSACGSLICHSQGMPLTSHLQKTKDTPRLSESKPKKRFVFLCSILPNTTETTRRTHHRSDSFTRQCQWEKKLRCRHWKFTNDSHTTAQVLLCYDCLRVTHRYRHGTHIFKPRTLSHGLGAHSYQVVKKSQKTFNLRATLMLNQEIKPRIMEQWYNWSF